MLSKDEVVGGIILTRRELQLSAYLRDWHTHQGRAGSGVFACDANNLCSREEEGRVDWSPVSEGTVDRSSDRLRGKEA